MKKIFDRLTALVMVMLMVIQTITPAITSFAKEEELDKRYVIQKLETLKQDTYANFSLNLATVIDDKNLDTDTNVKFVLNTTNINSNIKLLVRKDFSLYDERTFDTVEEAHKEFDRVDKSLKDQGLSLDVSVVQEDGKYRIHNNYVPQADKEDFGDDYKVYSLKVVPEFDFDKEGLFNKLPENLKSTEQHRLQLAEERRLQQDGEVPEGDKHNRTYIFDFKVDKAVDSKLTTIALNKDDNNPLEVKQNADLFAAILDDKTYSTYQTEQLPAEVTSSIEHKKEVAEEKAKADAKAKAEADAKAKAEAEEKAKKEAEEKAKADAKAKEEADAKAKQEAEKIKAEEAKKSEEQKALDEKAKQEADAKAKQEADAKAKAEAEKLKAEAEAKQKAEAEAKAKQEELAKKQAEAEAKKAAEEKAKKDLENKKLLGLVQDKEENQEEEPIIKKKETTEEVKKEPATPEERKQKAEEFDKALQDKKEEIKKSEDKKDANNKEDNKKTTDKKGVSKETKGLLEGIKEFFGLTNLQKADRELKAILSVKENGLKEVQALLSSFETKYHLTKEEQAKLMEDNKDAIKALIEKDADKNFDPKILMALMSSVEDNLKDKKFNIITRFDTSTRNGPIRAGQYFNIHLDDKLTVNNPSELKSIYNGNTEIARPTYDETTNTIKYKILNDINDNLQIRLNIPVDYNTANIKLDDNGEFVVVNKVSGLGVTNPKDLLPQRVGKDGKLVGSIIEPDRDDVTEIITPDDSNYKISTDAVANPVVKDGKLVGYNWIIKVTSDTDLESLGYKANFTTVKGSGLGEITSRDNTVSLTDQLNGAFGINDSKHHEPGAGIREVTYNLFTPTKNKQEKYMMDISIVLTKKNNKIGAKRIVIDEGWPIEKVQDATPSRVGMNNRTTVFGEFTSENNAKWTVTDGVSTGDEKTTLPLEERTLGNQTGSRGQTGIYKIYPTTGQMVQDTTGISGEKPIGTIAVYEYNSTIADNKNPQTLAGVEISKYQDIDVDQKWNLDQGLTMPDMTVKAVDPNNEETVLGEATTTESTANPDPAKRTITIKDVKVWNISNTGEASKNDIKIKQEFPTNKTHNGKAISYYETTNWKDPNRANTFAIANRATVEVAPQLGNFTLIKKGEGNKPLPGATFKLLGQCEAEVATDAEGKIRFQNIAPGSYQLLETKAPNGYKLNQETTHITVDENGRISASGSSAKLEVGGNPTVTVAHKSYPDFMNAMQYATINDDGSVTTYIYLKANEAKTGGSTDKDTRLNLILSSGQKFNNIKDVQVYDVNPYYRDYLRKEMIQQGVDQEVLKHIGNTNVLNAPDSNPIRATLYPKDPYTQKFGYRIRFPQERFARDWGFLVVAKSPAGTSVTYDWLMDDPNNTTVGNNARLENQTIRPTTAEDTKKETTLTVTNEKFETRPVEVTKWDKDKKPVAGATFEIRDANGKLISTVESQAADAEGKNGGLASFGDLPEGKYTIEEIRAPEGYIKSDVIFDVTVDESNQVTYKPRFKDKPGTPINGEDYYIEDVEQDQDKISAKVTNVTQSLVINEGDSGDIGFRPQVWEAYRLESLKYNATIDLSNTAPGQRFSIQFDRNLDFTQYFGEFPKIKVGGVEVADPYFDYTTNKLTYVYNEKSAGGKGQAKIELKGIIPSKYFAQNDGTFPFTVTVAPGQTGMTGQQTITTNVPADYGQYDYDGKNREVPQSYYFRDVYQGTDGKWYVAVLAYYNPDHIRESGPKELEFNWLSTNYQGATKKFFTWEGNGNKPAFSLTNVNVYRTSPNMGTIHAGNFDKKVNYNMPLSYGVRPGDDPAKYNLIYSRDINPNNAVRNDRQGGVTLNYDPSQIQEFGVITKNSPLRIGMPAINNFSKSGYIIEQTFKIDDLYKFNNLWRVFCMTNNDFKSSFITRANYNKATGDQAGGEIPKFFSQKVALINKKYTPGSFKIKKHNDANREQVLPGASFSLTDEAGNTIYRSSGQDGIVEFSKLKPGIYTLKEESAPDKFIKTDKTWRVNVGNDGYVSIVEIGLGSTGETFYGKDTILLPVANKPVATEFKVYKKDHENQPLAGAEFKITKAEDGTQVATGTSDKNGTVSFNGPLPKGTYILEETKAPAGYKNLDKKWVIEVDDNGKAKIYNYIKGPEDGTNPDVNKSILGEAGTKWVNVAKRPLDGWVLGDNRQTGYYNNYPVPFRLGTRIVAKNTNQKYVIQRYVINPEADTITLNTASIHRERPQFANMDWYNGDETYKIFELDKAVDGNVEDIRLENYKITDITKEIPKSKENISGQPRLYLNFKNRQITKPIVIDVKVPYKAEVGGVGTGMDLQTNKGLFWKSDYYDRANQIVEADPVTTGGEAGNIKGAYVAEDSLDVTNEKVVQKFSFKKIGDSETDALTGATFSLQGPKKSDDNLGPQVWKRSGTDGIVNFDNLTPGIYNLTESGAPQGYEKANTKWTVTVTKDGKIYMRDDNPGSTVPDQGAKWQKVDTTKTSEQRHTDSSTSNGSTGKIETKITEVNKKANKFRQVYILNRQPENLQNTYFELHAQNENRPINTSNRKIVSVNLVDRSSTFDNLKTTGNPIECDTEVYTKNNQERIKITPKNLAGEGKTIAITVESYIPNSGNVGTGMDFYNFGSNHYWVTEWYDTLAGIPLVEPTNTTTDKNATVYVGGKRATNNPLPPMRTDSSSAPLRTPVTIRQRVQANGSAMNDAVVLGLSDLDRSIRASMLEIGDNIVGTPVRAGEGWQPIDPTNSDVPTTRKDSTQQIQTKITHINKDEGKIRQVFLINKENIKMTKARVDFHAEPKNMNVIGKGINPKNFPVNLNVISVRPVSKNSTLDDIQYTGEELSFLNINYLENKYWRHQITLNQGNYQSPFAVVVEFEYQKSGSIGLGANYRPNRADSSKDYWAAESYTNGPSGINKTQQQAHDVNLLTSSDVGEGGTLSSSARTAKAGNTVTVTPQVNTGYILEKFEVLDASGAQVPYTNNGTSYSFTMPNSDVTVKARFKKQAESQTKHKINTQTPSNGTFTVDKTEAAAGEVVTITPKPAPGYKAGEIYVGSKNGQVPVNDNKFTMPDADVTIRVEFEQVSQPQPTKHNINIIKTEGGTVTADKSTADKGETVKLTITPDAGYEIEGFTLLDKNGVQVQGSSINHLDKTFTMPAEDVWVKILFKKSETPAKSFIVGSENDGGRGSVVVDPTQSRDGYAKVGEKVTFTLYPYNVYKATKATVTKSNGQRLSDDEVFFDPATNKGYFIMPDISPATGVTVRGVFVAKPAGERTVSKEITETLNYKTDVTVDPSLKPGERVTDKEGKNGEVKYRYTATYNKATSTGQTDIAAPADWPADVIAALKAGKQNGEVITAFARTEISRTEPTNAKVRVGKSDDPLDTWTPGPNDKLIKDGETQEIVNITNKKAGISPKIMKRTPGGAPLPGATFTVNKMTDNTYEKVEESFRTLTATSDKDGNVIFKDQSDNVVKFQKGYYVIKETKAPLGYKRVTAEWKIEVKDDGGRMYAEYQGPEDIPSSLIDNNKKSNAGSSASNDQIKYKARLTYIDPEAKTYIQRIYIDTRGYYGNNSEETKGLLNLQITPKYKREEIDTPGQPPKTIKDGVKTAYYQSFKLNDQTSYSNMDDPAIDKILRTYDLSNKDLSLDKTARWRPFDWGFDEDQLNIGKGVYIVEVEGFYDDVIINNKSKLSDKYDIPEGDLGKIDLNLNFYAGAREFQQLYEKPDGTFGYKRIEKGSYQGGAEALRAWIEKTQGKEKADAWAKQTTEGEKYQNFIGKHVKIGNRYYDTGRIYPALGQPTFKRQISANINPLYNSVAQQEIPKEGLELENEQETYNVTFSKHGRDNHDDDINSEKVTENRLEGAIFKLQIQGPGGIYEDMPGKTLASAFNGYFGFRNLKPGRYRLMEVKAPEGYKPIKDPVLHFTIAYQKGEIDKETGDITPGRGVVTLEYNEGNGIFQYAPDNPDITPEGGKLTDYVTSATAKNMGKIINERPGKGKVTLTKYDDGKHLLPGAEFRLTRLTRKVTGEDDPNKNDGVYTKVVGDDGTIVFDELPIGQYELEETKPAPGYQNKGQKWRFTVGGPGLDPYANDSEVGLRDISSKIEMTSTMSVQRPDSIDGTESEGNSKIHPHKGHALEFKNTFKINDDTVIKPGDYFTIKLSDNINLDGILKQKSYGLDLFADGVGTIAKAKYDKEAGTLTYVFTSYAEQYNKTDFENTISAHINLMKVQNSTQKVPVGMGIGTPTTNNIDVVYDLDTARAAGINMTSKIVSFDQETGEFVQYYYLNRDRTAFNGNQTFKYKPSENVTNLKFDLFSLNQNGGRLYNYNTGQYYRSDDYVNKDMPESFGVNEYSNNLRHDKSYGYYNIGANGSKEISIGNLGIQNSVIVKVTGKVTGKDIASYDTYALLYDSISSYYVERTNGIRIFENKTQASAKLNIKAINPKNEINFKKVDKEGKILPGAEFKLVKYYENAQDGKKWVEFTGSERTAGEDGLIKYEKLEAGRYALIETKAPDGYAKIEGHIQEFTVGTDGVITRQVVKPAEEKSEEAQTLRAKVAKAVEALADKLTGNTNTETYTEKVSAEPIEVVNYKNIEFEKVDANDKTKKLANAEFEVYYKEKEDGEYQAYKVTKDGKEVTKTVTSDKDGKISLNVTKPGYYALKETKAPDGYTNMPGYIKEFRVENGKLQILEKDPLKASHKTSTKGLLTSEIISVDKDKGTFKQRIVINPNHETMTVPSYQSYIRIKENDWKITPKYKDAMNQQFGLGGLVNVALLKKDGDKTLENLTKDDYKKYDAISFDDTVGNINGSRYGLKEMLGITTTDDKPIKTTDSIVMEFTGKLDANNTTGTADQLFELVFESGIDDQISDKLNVEALTSGKPTYGDYTSTAPIQIENRKATFPLTGALGIFGFLIAGAIIMTTSYYKYRKKKRGRALS